MLFRGKTITENATGFVPEGVREKKAYGEGQATKDAQ